mmetsp:Transcript_10697/g.33602  ORF Transcript_10697/g.33602 Transcript_10697/m.33602 type:complete len:222 (+) Transcript_10697:250-915(+)
MVVRHVHLAAVAIRSVDVAQHLVVLLPAEEDAVQVGIIQPEERIPDGNGLGAHGALLAGGLTAMHRGAEPVRGLGQRLEVLHHAEDRQHHRARTDLGLRGARGAVHAAAAAVGVASGDLPASGDAVAEAPPVGISIALLGGVHGGLLAVAVAAALASRLAAQMAGLPQLRIPESSRAGLVAPAPIRQREVAVLGHHLKVRLEVKEEVAEPREVLEVRDHVL